MKHFILLAFTALLAFTPAAHAADIKLPAPRREGGKPLMQALAERHSTRAFSDRPLSEQQLSDLLWAAFGVSRPDSGKRTAPSASNRQEIGIYVVLPAGAYLYEAQAHTLKRIAEGDLRAATGTQDYVGAAALNLVYVADFSKMQGDERNRVFYSAADTGFIAQNVYLYCASEGLGTVVRGLIDRDALAKQLKLNEHQRITLAQSAGYPQ